MQLILLSKERGHLGQVRLDSGRAWLGVVAVALITCAGVFYGGFKAAELFGISNPGSQVDTWRAEIANQQSILQGTRDALQLNLDALALRLGQMNAQRRGRGARRPQPTALRSPSPARRARGDADVEQASR